MAKTLCKSKKARKKCSMLRVCDATHVCRKCDRLADTKKKLCKPVKLAGVDCS